MATVPIHNPVLPFLGKITGGMRNGLVLKIRGQIQGISNRFQIDLQQGPALKPRDDVMLHLVIRPQENVIIRNHLSNQQFGSEERYGGNPIQANESFEITIAAEVAFYKISVNGQHFCTFNHRLSMHLAQYISVSGTGNIQYILVENDGNHGANPIYPSLPTAPCFPIATVPPAHYPPTQHYPPMHQCPVPPPMPPPPYPGLYPSHPNYPVATPYRKPKSSNEKMAAGMGAAVGVSISAISKAIINANKIKKK